MNLPSDNFILLSVVNTALRDKYSSLTELCDEEDADCEEITARLLSIGYTYDEKRNTFK